MIRFFPQIQSLSASPLKMNIYVYTIRRSGDSVYLTEFA